MPKEVKFTMRLTQGSFELVEGKWPEVDGQLWNGYCIMTDGSKKECQAVRERIGWTFYWGWSK